MNRYTIGELKSKGLPPDDFIGGMFYDWFVSDSALAGRGAKCLRKLLSVVKSSPSRFDDSDTIDFKNCQPGYTNRTYDCVRVWDKNGNFKYAFVPREVEGGCSAMCGEDGDIINYPNWKTLKEAFKANEGAM